MLVKVIRLTFLAICFFLWLPLISCKLPPENKVKMAKKQVEIAENALNINTATAEELEKLPRIGKGIAKRIIEYRQTYGEFRRAEHLILVHGMSDKKFRELQNLIKVE
jgi:competence protein ComEA